MAFDWSGVKGAIGTIAPWIAGSLGSPLAGVGVNALCQVLGLEPSKATPTSLQAALAGASPDQLLAIREADNRHAEVMKKLGYDHADQIEQTEESDRASARQREIAVKDSTPAVMAWMIVGGMLIACGAIFFGVIPTKDTTQAQLVGTAMGYLFAETRSVLAYFFGASRDGDAKTDIIADQAKQ